MQPKQLFKLFAKSEAVTWALLLTALMLRAFGDPIPVAVTIAGSIHGAVFLGYAVTALLTGLNQRWKIGRLVAAVGLAIVPFATIPFERKLEREEALLGAWRTTASADPRDSAVVDRLFRFFIARPLLLILTLVILLPAIFTFLLFLGPPTEWFD